MIPAYPLATGAMTRALENAASIVAGHTNDEGDYYTMKMATSVRAADVSANSVLVIPLDAPRAEQLLNFTFLAACKSMSLQVYEKRSPG